MKSKWYILSCLVLSVITPRGAGGMGDHNELDKHSPEDNVSLLSSGDLDPRGKFLVVKYYIDQKNLPFAVRAARKIEELFPAEKKAHAVFGYTLFLSRQFDDALVPLRKAYSLGDDDSLVPLALSLLALQSPNRDELKEYIPALEKIRLNNIEAYQPLMIYGLTLSDDERQIFSRRLFSQVDLRKLILDKNITKLLFSFFKSTGEEDKLAQLNALMGTVDPKGQ